MAPCSHLNSAGIVANPVGSRRISTDVITCDSTAGAACARAASTPGHAADLGQVIKDRKWVDLAILEGDQFFALAVEAGGRIGENAITS